MHLSTRVLGLILTAILFQGSLVKADPTKDAIADELAFMRRVYTTGYAPAVWKRDHFNWNLDAEYNKALHNLATSSVVGPQEYRKIISGFLSSMHDYHVGVQFNSTEAARLPFVVNGVGNRYFIVWIDQTKLNKSSFPFQVGDELVSFGGRPVADVVSEIKAQTQWGVDSTDQRLAERYLTARFASKALSVPNGQIMIEAKRAGPSGTAVTVNRELTWDYTPELIPWNPGATPLLQPTAAANPRESSILHPQMAWGSWQEWHAAIDTTPNPFQIGGRKSFVPDLGTKIWESSPNDMFYAYIYRNEQKKLIGYVRIPSYVMAPDNTPVFMEFKALMARFQSSTDGMVLDEVNNPGGSISYVLALMSVLSSEPVKIPRHAIKLWPSLIAGMAPLQDQLMHASTDEDVRKVLGSTNDGLPVDLTTGKAYLSFINEVMTDWRAGFTFTKPLFLGGVDAVNPDREVNYTKPVIVLVNELDFSGGDFFPATLQDNNRVSKRVQIFGARTSGAGGYILDVQFPSSMGMNEFSFTGSIAARIDDQPIENLGVTPDIPYQLTVKDMTNGFSDYKDAVNAAIAQKIQ